jgi:hypothetical protein
MDLLHGNFEFEFQFQNFSGILKIFFGLGKTFKKGVKIIKLILPYAFFLSFGMSSVFFLLSSAV